MKEKKTVPERTIVIDIKPTRGLVVTLSCVLVIVALLAYLTLTGERAVAAEAGTVGEASLAQSTGMRQFYLTTSSFYADETLTACADGYHFASLWEIADPANLKYNTTLGQRRSDSDQGPPSSSGLGDGVGVGYVRTGYAAASNYAAGQANCQVWSIYGLGAYGTVAWLPSDWTASNDDVGVWAVAPDNCVGRRVWCIED